MHSTSGRVIAVLVSLGASAAPAGAGVFRDIAIGLDYAGFNFLGPDNVDIRGRTNLLSGGADFLTTVNFNGSVFDFGPWDLRMQGPVSIGLSTGGRLLSTLDVSFQTALSPDAAATPLRYELNLDSGNQLSTIGGTLLVDGDLSINGFGFYDLAFTYSSRQDVSRDGRYADDFQSFDLDVGPIRVRGNIFADALALAVSPFLGSTEQSNPFIRFSSSAQLKEILSVQGADDLALLAAQSGYSGAGISSTLRLADGTGGRSISFSDIGRASNQRRGGLAAVPEPPVLLLLVLCVPAIMSRGRGRITSRA
ncbi:MAG: hypothetical protein ACE5HE_02710 [Phycisphaerae bacterium]